METRQIEKYPNYSIREDGEVISYKRNPAGAILKCGLTNSGYRKVTLFNSEGPRTVSIHRLMSEVYSDKLEPPTEVCNNIDHKDENKLNNHYSNLRWCTSSQNRKYHIANNPDKFTGPKKYYKPVDLITKEHNKLEAAKKRSEKDGLEKGIRISVNGVTYNAVRQAARHILECEAALGITKNVETIRKELQLYAKGKRPSWTMYGKYKIGDWFPS